MRLKLTRQSLWIFILAIKPFVDLTWNLPLFSFANRSINLLSVFGVIVLFLTFSMYLNARRSKRIFNEGIIWFFFLINMFSAVNSLTGGGSLLSVADTLIRILDAYLIYFIFNRFLESSEERLRFYGVIWGSTLLVSLLSVLISELGVYGTDVTGGVTRFSGLYNDPGGPSYNAIIAILFGSLYISFIKKKAKEIPWKLKIVFYITVIMTLYIMKITITKSALLMLAVFMFMWYGVFKKKLILVLPLIIISSYYAYQSSVELQTRMAPELRFIQQGELTWESARSLGTGRVTTWREVLRKYQDDYSFFDKIIGIYRTFGAHNQYIAFLMQIGLIGLLIFLIFIARFYLRLIKLYNSTKGADIFAAITLLTMYCIYGITGHPFYYTTLLWYLMILLSLINIRQYLFKPRIEMRKTHKRVFEIRRN